MSECRRELTDEKGWLICHRCGSLWQIYTMEKDWRPLSCVERSIRARTARDRSQDGEGQDGGSSDGTR